MRKKPFVASHLTRVSAYVVIVVVLSELAAFFFFIAAECRSPWKSEYSYDPEVRGAPSGEVGSGRLFSFCLTKHNKIIIQPSFFDENKNHSNPPVV